MINSLDFYAGITKPKLVHTVVLYHKETGEIRHIHNEVFYDGALELDKHTMEKKAFEFPEERINRQSDQTKVLHLRNYEFKRGAKYIVDVSTTSLVEKK
jgi:hypothetical protein